MFDQLLRAPPTGASSATLKGLGLSWDKREDYVLCNGVKIIIGPMQRTQVCGFYIGSLCNRTGGFTRTLRLPCHSYLHTLTFFGLSCNLFGRKKNA